jgi:hypothetical protein
MLNLNYPSIASAYNRFNTMDDATLFEYLGWSGLVGSSGYVRNGALIMSLALIATGAPLRGSLRINQGELAGGKVETGANRLAEWLASSFLEPELISLENGLLDVASQLYGRRGIVAFEQATGPAGGVIALQSASNAQVICNHAERIHPVAVRFWPLY